MNINIENYESLFDIITIKTDNYILALSNHGAGIIDLKTPDKNNIFESIALGYSNLEKFYEDNDYYFGKTIGRFAGRIENGTFTLNNINYKLEINDIKLNSNLHSGSDSIEFKNFNYTIDDKYPCKIIFEITEDHSQFKTKMEYEVVYTLYNDYFTIEHYAKTNLDTICNMTNHVYFNLSGDFKYNILDHVVQMDSNIYKNGNQLLPVNDVFDFRNPKSFRKYINHPSLEQTMGYDHYFKFNNNKSVIVKDLKSKRCLQVSGNSNGVVIYTGGYFHGELSQCNTTYQKHDGFTLEFQNMPNGINTDYSDEQSILRKDETYYQIISYKFSLLD